MFYEVLMEKQAAKRERKKPSRIREAGQGLRAFAPGLVGIPMLGGGLMMAAHDDANALGKVTGSALALGGGALLAKGVRDSLRVKRENRELRERYARRR